jgi:shikimate kinase
MGLILIGLKHCGKTTLGRQLARALQQPFLDTDELLLQHYPSTSISALYTQYGEHEFRRMEQKVIQSIESHHIGIIATGGGSVLNAANVTHLQALGTLMYLQLSFATWCARLTAHAQPAFLTQDQWQEMYQQRHVVYQRVAQLTVNVDNSGE